jgi:hypothetical protein
VFKRTLAITEMILSLVPMKPCLPPGPLRAFRRDGKLVIEIDEHRFCADAFLQSESRLLDRDAFLAFACEILFTVLHDATADEQTWWARFCQAIGEGAADAGAGVRLGEGGEDRLPIDQPPELFPDEVTRELLGAHVKQVALSV